MKQNGTIGILGSGSWATAIAKIILTSQPHINWFIRRPEQVEAFKALGHNPSYLQAIDFELDKITFFTETEINKFFRSCDAIILITPSPYIKGYLKKVRKANLRDKFIVNAIKGLVPDENVLISQYLMEEFDVPRESIGVIGGPCHAEEVARRRRSYLTVACCDLKKAEVFAQALRNDFVSCVTSNDIEGVQYASVLKNIYAIAAGICNGLQYGDNFQSVLISNAIAEMNTFINAVHLIKREITDSVYLGDLLVTAYSQFSRNRTFGNMIGRGYSVRAAQSEMEMIAEGYFGTKCIREINKHYQVNLPICDAVFDILYNKKDPEKVISKLSHLFK